MEQEPTEQIECKKGNAHEWLIDSPNGPVSKGECLNCGQVSEFKNSMPVSGWDRTDNSKKNDEKNDSKKNDSKKNGTESGKS